MTLACKPSSRREIGKVPTNPSPPVTRAQNGARKAFDDALRDLLDEGHTVPCSRVDHFTSDERSDRAAVLDWCRRCPLMTACAALADEEQPSWGVWAGVDHSPRPATRKA